MNRTQSRGITTEEAEVLAQEIAEKTAEVARLESEMNERLAAVAGTYQPAVKSLQAEIEAKSGLVLEFARRRRDAWPNRKSWPLLPFVTVKASQSSARVEYLVKKVETVIERLKKAGFGSLVQTSESVSKNDLKKIDPSKHKALGFKVVEAEETLSLSVDLKKFQGAKR